MKHLNTILGMAVFAIMAAACSSDDAPEQLATGKGISFTAIISTEQVAGTRYVEDKGSYIESGLAVNEEIALVYEADGVECKTKATVKSLSGNKAVISATLVDGVTNGTAVTLIYPYSASDYETADFRRYEYQDGTLSPKIDLRWAKTTFTISGGTASLPNGVTLEPDGAICKFTVQDSDGYPIKIKSMKVTSGDLPSFSYNVTLSTPASTFYMVLFPSNAVHSFEARKSGGDTYDVYVAAGTASLIGGKFYQPTLKMKKEPIGWFLGKDGSLSYFKRTSGDQESYAVIGHWGTIENYCDRFIALALEDVDANKHSWSDALSAVGTYAADHPITIGSTEYNTNSMGSNCYDIVQNGEATSSATATELKKGWRLPSVTDWRYILAGIGKLDTPTPTNPLGVHKSNTAYGKGSTLRTNINAACGNEALVENSSYWLSSNLEDEEWSWYFKFNAYNDISMFQILQKSDLLKVRSVFAY